MRYATAREVLPVALLDVRKLSVSIPTPDGDVHAVRSVDLQIERGQIHGVIGESGCGKTMTGMAALGLVPKGARIAADRFHFDGEDLRENARGMRGRRIGLISQDPAAALNPVLSIARQLDDVEAKIAQLKTLRGELRRMVAATCDGPAADCRVIEALALVSEA